MSKGFYGSDDLTSVYRTTPKLQASWWVLYLISFDAVVINENFFNYQEAFADNVDRTVCYTPDTLLITLRIKVCDGESNSTGFYIDIILTYSVDGILPRQVEFEIEGTYLLSRLFHPLSKDLHCNIDTMNIIPLIWL